MFNPPDVKDNSLSLTLWFGAMYICFYIFDTVVMIPYMSLGPEISSNSKEREKMYIWVYIFQYVGAVASSTVPIIVKKVISVCDCSYCDTLPDKDECIPKCQAKCNTDGNEIAYSLTAIFMGAYFVFTIFLLSSTYREKNFYRERRAADKPHIISSLQRIVSNKPFLIILTSWILDSAVMQIFVSIIPFYVNIILNPQKICKENGTDLTNIMCTSDTW